MALNPKQFNAYRIGEIDYKGHKVQQWAVDWPLQSHAGYQCPHCLNALYKGITQCLICGLPTTFFKTIKTLAKTRKYYECSVCHGLTSHLYHGDPPPFYQSGDFPKDVYCADCWHGLLDCAMILSIQRR